MKLAMNLVCVGVLATSALAATIDGTVDGAYGAALAVQDTPTGFGDNNDPDVRLANGSELNAAFATISGGNLNVLLTGNLESNFNKLEIFIDSKAGGQNQLRGDNPDVDFNGLNRMGDDGSGNGLKFDMGFEPDYYVTATGGNNPYELFASGAELLTAGGGAGDFFGGSDGSGAMLTGGNNFLGLMIAIDNSNVLGVTGADAAGAAAVTTGIEFSIPLANLDYSGGEIKIAAMINGGGHDFLSNQVLGGIGGAANLGEPRAVDFSQIDGDQFFVIPEPASILMLALAAGLIRRR